MDLHGMLHVPKISTLTCSYSAITNEMLPIQQGKITSADYFGAKENNCHWIESSLTFMKKTPNILTRMG
jgi:hypothetical protein